MRTDGHKGAPASRPRTHQPPGGNGAGRVTAQRPLGGLQGGTALSNSIQESSPGDQNAVMASQLATPGDSERDSRILATGGHTYGSASGRVAFGGVGSAALSSVVRPQESSRSEDPCSAVQELFVDPPREDAGSSDMSVVSLDEGGGRRSLDSQQDSSEGASVRGGFRVAAVFLEHVLRQVEAALATPEDSEYPDRESRTARDAGTVSALG